MDINGKTAIVFGGTSGIGLSATQMLSDKGAHVIALSRNPDKLKSVPKNVVVGGNPAKEIKKLDSTIEGITRIKLFEDPGALKDLYDQIDRYTLKNNSSFEYLKSKILRNKDH